MEYYTYTYEHQQDFFQNELPDSLLAGVVLSSLYSVSGKTTLANILTELIPNHERIVLIEDAAEMQIQKDNFVRFETRREQNGVLAVTIRDLLKATLRHRPDRIILGEIRGGEALDLFQLLNTGPSGTISTVLANSATQGVSRFATCVLQSGVEIPYRAIKTNIADSFSIVVHIECRPGLRFVSEVLAVGGFDSETDTFRFDRVYCWEKPKSAAAGNL